MNQEKDHSGVLIHHVNRSWLNKHFVKGVREVCHVLGHLSPNYLADQLQLLPHMAFSSMRHLLL